MADDPVFKMDRVECEKCGAVWLNGHVLVTVHGICGKSIFAKTLAKICFSFRYPTGSNGFE